MKTEGLEKYLKRNTLEFKEIKDEQGNTRYEATPPNFKYVIYYNKEKEQYDLTSEDYGGEWVDTFDSASTLEEAIEALNISYNTWSYFRKLESI